MEKFLKVSNTNKLIFLLSNLYEMYEAFSIDSIFIRCLEIMFYFSQMTSFVYFFALKDMKTDVAKYFCYFHYYLNPILLVHNIEYKALAFFLFFLFQALNIIMVSNMCFRFFKSKKQKFASSLQKINIFKKGINFFADTYQWFVILLSLEIFLIGFQSNDEYINYIHEYLSAEMLAFLQIFGILGIFLTGLLGLIFLYLNQDYKFLDLSKIRCELNVKLFFSFLIRIIEAIFFTIFKNFEWIHFALNYLFLLISGGYYLTNFPIRNKKISIFYASYLIYSFLHLTIFTLFRLGILINEEDLLPMNIIFFIFSFTIGSNLYDNFYMNNFIFEDKKKKILIFTLEEIVRLYYSYKKQLELNFLISGYFRFHKKYCFNQNCSTKKEQLPNSFEDTELRKEYIMEFIFSNFKELIETNKTRKMDEIHKESFEILVAKYLSFLLNYGFNPIRNFYEVQKTLSQKKAIDFSFYFKILTDSLNKDLKRNVKIFLNKKKFDAGDLKRKNTYDEFFKIMSTKKKLENDFRKLLLQKINYFEKMSGGLQNLEELFIFNMKLAPMVFEFQDTLEKLNNNSHFSKLLRYKFSCFLNILILNHFSDAILDEKNLKEYFKSKTEDLIDKEFMLQFFQDDTVVCELSFLKDINGKIHEKCKTPKFLNFFGYSKDDDQKIGYLSNILPQFLRLTHHRYVTNFLAQNRKSKVNEIAGHALDKDGFAFPIKVSAALRSNNFEDFAVVGAITKQDLNFDRFCLCDLEGNILNISSRFFFDFKNNYELLNIEDIKYINIFNLIENSKELFTINDSFDYQKEEKSILNFPKKLHEFIERKKMRERENEFSTKNKDTIISKSKTKEQIDSSASINPQNNPLKTVEIIFNWSKERLGQDDYQINIIVINIMKFKELVGVQENLSPKEISIANPENILNSTLVVKDFLDCKSEDPNFINVLANDSNVNDHFGTKFKIKYQEAPKTHLKTHHRFSKKEVSPLIQGIYNLRFKLKNIRGRFYEF